MSYITLYRKYRPSFFNQVKGQNHIVETLKNQIKNSRIGNAYLFCGTRGTGKTSIAKIFAKTVNCENIVDGEPCNKCDMCNEINNNISLNVIEIDAASNNSVDDVRKIKEEVEYPPSRGKYKVYIIDEVHMLSTAAFNALLKTLEEPPSYVIFILATTNVFKIPLTICSRCQKFSFNQISTEDIKNNILEIAQKEKFNIDEKSIYYIANLADGSMRDALSILEQCVSFSTTKEIKYNDVLNIFKVYDPDKYSDFLKNISDNNVFNVIKDFDYIITSGIDISVFINDFIWHIRNLLLLSTGNASNVLLNVTKERFEKLKEEALLYKTKNLFYYIDVLSQLNESLKKETNERIFTEMALIKMCQYNKNM